MGEQCGRLSLGDDDGGGGQVVVGKWVNFTFVDLDAHGCVDCLATFKLGHDNKHDNKHATRGPSQPTKGHKTGNKQKKSKNKKHKSVQMSQ